MNEALQAVASTTAKTVDVSAGLKWGAVLCGLGLLVLLSLAIVILAPKGNKNPWRLVEGADGSNSTSKFQWFLWLVVILFSYTALWVLRAEQGNFSALSEIPVNLLTVLGFSTGTAIAAKGITTGYVQTGRVAKLTPTQAAAQQLSTAQAQAAVQANTGGQKQAGQAQVGSVPASGGQTPSANGGILQDDSGIPELAKIQMVGFTFIAVGIFLITVIHQIASNDITSGLPNIDSSLLVLMGISEGGYLGKKLVTFGVPTLYPPSPDTGPSGTVVMLAGANLGSASGSQLLLNNEPISATWSNSNIQFTVPDKNPVGNAAWKVPKQVAQLTVSTGGQTSNPVAFTVTPLQQSADPNQAAGPTEPGA